MKTRLDAIGEVLEDEVRSFVVRTPESRARFERAVQAMPGGDTRASTFYLPYPAAIARAAGDDLVDLDANHYVDFLFNYTSMILGHSHPSVVAAATAALESGSAVAAPAGGQVELAEELKRRVPGVERVRFTSSGTEAAMMAIRATRAFTRRNWVIKMFGGYHGSSPDLDAGIGDSVLPPGVPAGIATRAVSFNDSDTLERVTDSLAGDLAAIILEPVLGNAGLVAPAPGYLEMVRDVADRAGALLIFDEVMTFRLSRGGYQVIAGVSPDLTCFGKIIGGGFPVGAVGARAEVMEVFRPGNVLGVSHSGTFNGNPVTMAAGRETLRHLTGEAYARLDALGTRLATGLEIAIDQTGVRATVTHVGSLVNVLFADPPVINAETARPLDPRAAQMFHLGLMNRGIFIAPRGLFALSLASTDEHVDRAVDAAREVLRLLAAAGLRRPDGGTETEW